LPSAKIKGRFAEAIISFKAGQTGPHHVRELVGTMKPGYSRLGGGHLHEQPRLHPVRTDRAILRELGLPAPSAVITVNPAHARGEGGIRTPDGLTTEPV